MIDQLIQPHSVDTERAILGTMLLDKEAVGITLENITDEDFYKPQNSLIFRTIRTLYDENAEIDILTVSEKLKSEDNLDNVGGEPSIAGLTNEFISLSSLEYYCGILRDKSLKRKIISISNMAQSICFEDKEEAELIISGIQFELMRAEDKTIKQNYIAISDILKDVFKNIQTLNESGHRLRGINTGFGMLNRYTGGWQKTNLIILAGKTGQGKTSLALDFILEAVYNVPVGLFTLEMSAEEIVERLIQKKSRVDISKMNVEKFTVDEWRKITEGTDMLYGSKLYISDKSGITISELMARAKRMKREKKIELLVVDYLQLVVGNGQTREQEVASISRGLKSLAMNLNIPVIAISQFSRKADERSGTPQLSDLRSSGSLEQEANIVIMIYKSDDEKDEFVLDVQKNRSGKTGSFLLKWMPESVSFGQLVWEDKK